MALQHQNITINGERVDHYFLCNYRPQYKGSDELSKSLIRFKMSSKIDVEAWTECSILELSKLKFENLLIIRILGNEEVKISQNTKTAMDWLAHKLAAKLNGLYNPELLYKKRQTKPLKYLQLEARIQEMNDVYNFTNHKEYNQILILDDILTTGTTIKEVVRSIRMVTIENSITCFTLARTDHQADLNRSLKLMGDSYSWRDEEWAIVAEEVEFYELLSNLKSRILNDSFN